MTTQEPEHAAGGGVEASALYVVATPIGNLRDITLRALDVLKGVDAIAAEDTRHSRLLLEHYGIATRIFAVHEHNERAGAERIIDLLAGGKAVALITDAGTPAISDPGAVVVNAVLAAGHKVVPIPGSSAVITALSAAGSTAPGFAFLGFLPTRSGQRRSALQPWVDREQALVFYEAPHRVVDCLADVAHVFGPDRQVTLCRELTKRFESLHRCIAGEAVAWLAADDNHRRGEFVIVIDGAVRGAAEADPADAARVLGILLQELPTRQAAALAAQLTGLKKNQLYEMALAMKRDAGANESAPESGNV